MKYVLSVAVLLGCLVFAPNSCTADEMACMEACMSLADAQDNLQYWDECWATALNHVIEAEEKVQFYVGLRDNITPLLEQAELALEIYLANHPNDADQVIVGQLQSSINTRQNDWDVLDSAVHYWQTQKENWSSIKLTAASEQVYWQQQVNIYQTLVNQLNCSC